jgi:hypothetical protein
VVKAALPARAIYPPTARIIMIMTTATILNVLEIALLNFV